MPTDPALRRRQELYGHIDMGKVAARAVVGLDARTPSQYRLGWLAQKSYDRALVLWAFAESAADLVGVPTLG